MSLKVMNILSGDNSIVESTENYDSRYEICKNTPEQASIEDDIDKLFEAIRDGSHKSATKRPVIGISESASLKKALRGLSISQASKMAAVKKQTSGQLASPGVSKILAIRKLHRATVTEASENLGQPTNPIKGNVMEMMSLVPERSSLSTISDKIVKSRQFLTLEISKKNEIVPTSNEGSIISTGGDHKDQENKLRSKALELSRRSLSRQNFVKKRIASKMAFASKSQMQHNEGAKKDNFDQCSETVSQTIDSLVENGCEEISRTSKSSIGECSSTSYSDESCLGGTHSGHRHILSKDLRWEAINCIQKKHGSLSLKHFKLLKKIGGGDIGAVYVSELIGTSCLFALKITDNEFLTSREKIERARTEREILEILDHPFLPTLYAHFTTNKLACLVMEYCPGGDLRALRTKQVTKCFTEQAARFYAAEVLLALEYLHMLGVVYRNLKPENILIQDDGHVLLLNFDLSLRCAVNNPSPLKSSSNVDKPPKKISSPRFTPALFLSTASKTRKLKSELTARIIPSPHLGPMSARSNSIETYEYLAPEIIKGEPHGSTADWWMFGILLYEMLYGTTPFKGSTNEETISHVGSQRLEFPQSPMVSSHAQDLMRRVLKKEPENRLSSTNGATEIKGHAFFEGLNWALIRSETPPDRQVA